LQEQVESSLKAK